MFFFPVPHIFNRRTSKEADLFQTHFLSQKYHHVQKYHNGSKFAYVSTSFIGHPQSMSMPAANTARTVSFV